MTPKTEKKSPIEVLSPPLKHHEIIDRKDLSKFFGVKTKYLNYILYGKDRGSFYREFTINKASGKLRTLHAVTGDLRKLQRIALDKLQAELKYKPSSYSHGFTPQKSIITNAAIHRRRKRIIKVDLKDFFPCIHFGRVQGMFMAPPFKFGKEAATALAQLSCLDDRSGALPQGGVLSPYISNMICRRLDKKLAKIAQNFRCRFTRYADDITLSTNDIAKLDVNALLEEVYQVIESEKFVVNKEKTKVLTPKDRQIVTGIVVNDGMNVNRKYIRNLRATIKNCEIHGVAEQIKKKRGFNDARNSRIALRGDKAPTGEYFLKHLFGKINFFGNVVLSNGQDEQHAEDPNRYKRIRTYEGLLWRFWQLKEVEKGAYQAIKEVAKAAIDKRPYLVSLLLIDARSYAVRKAAGEDYKKESRTKDNRRQLEEAKSIEDITCIVDKLKLSDSRFFGITLKPEIKEAKEQVDKLLEWPPICQKKTARLLESLTNPGELEGLVHSNDKFSVKDCYHALIDNYEGVFYYLPIGLKQDFENWKKALNSIATKYGEDHFIDVVKDENISEQTKELKINTRFGGAPADSSNLTEEIQAIIDDVSTDISIEIKGKLIKHLYTHVPSILKAIKKIILSMEKHAKTYDATSIYIESMKDKEFVEIAISDNSKMPAMAGLDNRNFVHGKLKSAIQLTNGLCDYWIELSLSDGSSDGSRASLDMHTETRIAPDQFKNENGFVHRLRFPPIT